MLGNLLSNHESVRIKRAPGRILIVDRYIDVYGIERIALHKKRADFMDQESNVIQTHVTCGDIDGDGLQELVVSSGKGGGNRLQILDDRQTGFAKFSLPGSRYGVVRVAPDILQFGGDGEMLTSVGDFDGDGTREIAVGFTYPVADQILILNGAADGFSTMDNTALDDGYLVTTDESKASFQGSVVPVAVDFDRDGIDEIVHVYASDGVVDVELFDDARRGFLRLKE